MGAHRCQKQEAHDSVTPTNEAADCPMFLYCGYAGAHENLSFQRRQRLGTKEPGAVSPMLNMSDELLAITSSKSQSIRP